MKGKSAMPQRILPLIPRGATQINGLVSVWRDDESWTYFLATHPIYSHRKNDHRMFRLITSQLIESGGCRQIDIIKTFGISKSSVIRAVKKLRDQGPEAFFVKHQARRGGKVFSADVLEQAQRLLDQGYSRSDAAKELGVKYDTFRKAINDGRLVESSQPQAAISKSSRSMIDAAAADEMGVACTRVGERVLASLGKLVGAEVSFETCLDVPKAGVLCALPALVANGLFARFAEMTMHPETEDKPARYKNWLEKKAGLLEEIENFEYQLKELKAKLKDTSKHISWGQLDEKDKFLRLLPGRKRLMDTIRMIAYRAETAMVGLITSATVDSSDARRLLQDLFVTEADILPDPENEQLNIRVHSASRPAANRALAQLFEHLNNAEVKYPGTEMRLVYELGGYTSPDMPKVSDNLPGGKVS